MLLKDQIARNRRRSVLLVFLFALLYGLLGAVFSFLAFNLRGAFVRAQTTVDEYGQSSGGGWTVDFHNFHPHIQQENIIAVAACIVLAGLWGLWMVRRGQHRVVKAFGAQEILARETAPRLWDAVEVCSLAAGIPMPAVYLMKSGYPNAFAAGSTPETSLVCASTALVAMMDKAELEGVIAHEIAHIRNLDVRLVMYAAVLSTALWGITSFFWQAGVWTAEAETFDIGWDDDDNDSDGWVLALAMIVLSALVAIIASLGSLLRFAVSKQREYMADATSADLTRYPQGLASALRIIDADTSEYARSRRGRLKTPAAMGELCFVGLGRGWLNTHPPIEERIKRLDELAHGIQHTHQQVILQDPGVAPQGPYVPAAQRPPTPPLPPGMAPAPPTVPTERLPTGDDQVRIHWDS